ncbi:Spy/CpxP family protein refolding chaperone [Methylomonas sp. AM2-LC]|uniref:Spy/CpxP family protein refolding chaperone n=1 Tax=Methylomonas sp. AM2-LC TaxID=3153301 RepID=UPI003265FBB7
MRKTLLILTLLAPGLALAEPPIQGEPPFGDFRPNHHGPDGGDKEHLPGFLQGIDLSTQQKTDIKNLFQNNRTNFDSKREEDKKVAIDLHRLSFSNDFNDKNMQVLLEKAASAHKEMILQKATLDNSIYKLLTAEQQQKVQKNLAQNDGGFGRGQ